MATPTRSTVFKAETPDDAMFVLCTAPDQAAGARLARGLVDERLAACVNVIPGVRSFYRWKGTLHEDVEVQLFIKTRRGCVAPIAAWMREHHPYDVPEVIALPVHDGSADYLGWVTQQTGGRVGAADETF